MSSSTRILGLTLLDSEGLRDAKICLFKERWSRKKSSRILATLSKYAHEGGAWEVALLLPPSHLQSGATRELVRNIRAWCRQEGKALHCYPSQSLQALIPASRAHTQALMDALCHRYPELHFARKRELSNNNHYYSKLFGAVGVATLHVGRATSRRT